MNRKTHSIQKNAILNALKTIFVLLFPLITLPYSTRVLHVENIGRYNFCLSIVSFFSLFAGLGINSYAIREGSRYKEDGRKLSAFASEIYTINIISTIIAYIVLMLAIAFIPLLRDNAAVIMLLSLSMLLVTFGREWIFSIFENYSFLTLSSIAAHILGLSLLFSLVRDERDLLLFTSVSLISSYGAAIINGMRSRSYCKCRFVIDREMLKHIPPIMVLFSNVAVVQIYVHSDALMLGFLSGDFASGIYAVATRIYLSVKSIIASIILVSMPVLSAYVANRKKKEFSETADGVFKALAAIALPAMTGLVFMSRNIIFIIAGEGYEGAAKTLCILSVAIIFSIFSWFYTECILIPHKREGYVLCATMVAAVLNVILNLRLIPLWGYNAAAFTTLIAEAVSMLLCIIFGNSLYRPSLKKSELLWELIACIGIAIICIFINHEISSIYLSTLLAVLASLAFYFSVLKFSGNDIFRWTRNIFINGKGE